MNIFNFIEKLFRWVKKILLIGRGSDSRNTELDMLHYTLLLLVVALVYVSVAWNYYNTLLIEEYMNRRLHLELPPVIKTVFGGQHG